MRKRTATPTTTRENVKRKKLYRFNIPPLNLRSCNLRFALKASKALMKPPAVRFITNILEREKTFLSVGR